jgi:hypothetical protein
MAVLDPEADDEGEMAGNCMAGVTAVPTVLHYELPSAPSFTELSTLRGL